jgi:hypothetical protein
MIRKVIAIVVLMVFLSGLAFNTCETWALSSDPALNDIFDWEEPTVTKVKDKLGSLISYTTRKFKDIKSSDWYISSLSKLVGLSGIDGYKDGTFKPQNSINVAEFTKTLLAAAGYKQELVKKVWYTNYVNKAKELGVIEASDNYVYTSGMKRKDMAKMICKLLKVEPGSGGNTVFADAKGMDTKWIDAAYNTYLIRGYYSKQTRTFKPNQTATRAEVTEMVMRALEYRENPEEYKASMSKYYDNIERAQDEKDGVNTGTEVKGYRIPTDPAVTVNTNFSMAEIFITLNVSKPLDMQYKHTESILASKFGGSNVVEVMNYIKQLTDTTSILPKKEFIAGGQTISVGGQNGTISIIIYPKE